jgi:elongation factor G
MSDMERIRNIGIIAHIDAGKTTTTEGILYFSGLSHRYGKIDDGTTVMDFLPEERERGITIAAAAASIPWGEHMIHLIDTPGHIDFTAEVERSLRVIDGAVVIFSGVEGVEAQSEKVWHQADRYHVPKIAFINKLDRVGASFPRVLGEINAKFGNCALPVMAPIGIEGAFESMVDLVNMELVTFAGETNETVNRSPIPEEYAEEMEERREAMIERLADECEAIAEAYLEGEEIGVDLLKSRIRELTIERKLVPVFVGSGKKSIGIQPLVDGVVDYLPSPEDCQDIPAEDVKKGGGTVLHPDGKAPFAGLIFKVSASKTADLFYVRTYQGTLTPNATLLNPRTGEKVRPKQIFKIYAKSTESLTEVGPGDIVGIVGLRNCGIGDTLCEPRHPVALGKINFPDPVISMALEPRLSSDKDKLDEVLDLLCREDQTLTRNRDEETGQRILSGMGELHLEINLKRVAQEFNLEVRVGEPRVAYRETLKAACSEHVVFSRTIGETELFAEVGVSFRPLAKGEETFVVRNSVRGVANIRREFVAAAERALADGLRTGGSHGYPLIYLAAELTELKVDPAKTTEGAVVGAVLQAIDQAIRKVGTVMLEPLMHLEVMAPDDCIGEISMYIQPRRAVIHDMLTVGEVRKISCEVPLAEMFGFGKALPRLSGGRGSFSMEPCGYQPLPADVVQRMFGEY